MTSYIILSVPYRVAMENVIVMCLQGGGGDDGSEFRKKSCLSETSTRLSV